MMINSKFLVLITLISSFVLFSCSSQKNNSAQEVQSSEQLNNNKSEDPKNGTPVKRNRVKIGYAQNGDHSEILDEVNGRNGDGQQVSNDENKPKTINGSAVIETHEQSNHNVYYLHGAEELKLQNYYFDIPVVYNKQVQKWINYFLNKGKDYFIRYSERSGVYAPVLGQILEVNGLPRDLIFLAMAESGFQNNAKSSALAVGPWQFMPFTGRKYGLNINFYVDERRDPFKATVAASNYLKSLYELFGSWELAAAGYNAGEGKVGRAIKKYSTENFWALSEKKFLKSETKNYVPKIMALAILGKNLDAFGLSDIKFSEPLDFDEIEVKGNSDLFYIANAINVDSDELFRLNPELLRWQTPPTVTTYKLRVPPGSKKTWEECCISQDFQSKMYQTYKISKSSQTYKSIAKNFRIPAEILANINNADATEINHALKKGSVLLLPFREGQSIKDPMYADLYDLPRRSILRKRDYRSRIMAALKTGTSVKDPKEFYVVKKGDTLWDVSNKTGVSLNNIIKSNIEILNSRPIRAGDRLVIR